MLVLAKELSKEIVLDKSQTDKRNELILKRYKVNFDMSEDLRDL